MSQLQRDRAGRRRSPATMPGFLAGRRPRNKGLRYPADPPKVEEIIAVMHAAGDSPHGRRLRGLIVILWRAGLRIQEALDLTKGDLDQRRGSLLVRRGKGGRRREVGMDDWGWQELQPWLELRIELPIGPLFCVISDRRAADRGRPPLPARNSAAARRRPGCADASHHINSDTPTPSRWFVSSQEGSRSHDPPARPAPMSSASSTQCLGSASGPTRRGIATRRRCS